jgi:type I restriction enzyme S subunit
MVCVSNEGFIIIQDIINKHVADCCVYAFDSWYKGTSKSYSDLNLAFDGGKPLDIIRIQQLKEAFEDSSLPYRVDVVDYRAVSEEFRVIIDCGNERIFIKENKVNE